MQAWIFNKASPTVMDFSENVMRDYLYKWYLWCISCRELTTQIPSITIPDGRDLYQGNSGRSNKKTHPAGDYSTKGSDTGGYKMSPDLINMVQETQTSHLPDPFDPRFTEQGIKVCFTECNIGGLSLAILEDRKFKSVAENIFPEAKIINGWPTNRYWSPRYNSRIGNAVLLGDRQLTFLEQWASDWSHQVWMKAVLSQTLFADIATIPRDSINDEVIPLMEIPDSGVYIEGDKFAIDFNSDGWPQNERDKAIKIFRKAFATHITGDRQPGSTIQYGTDDFRDANYAISTPVAGNICPYRWFPPYEGGNRKPPWPRNLGDFEDGFGNKITVYAIANPQKTKIKPLQDTSPSPGFNVITFNRHTRDIELAAWLYYSDPSNDKPLPFWPVKFNQMDNFGKTAAGWLPEIKVEGLINPVVKIIREYTGELIYSMRIHGQSFQPEVFETGYYRIEVGEPDENRWQKLEKVYPTPFREREPVTVKF